MLDSFLIKNFRLFSRLEINPLKRVNLIVGKNCAGKSALLEAVELYASNLATHVIVDQIAERQEIWKEPSPAFGQIADVHAVRHLFHNHRLPAVGEPGISLGPALAEQDQVQLRVAAYRVEKDQQGVVRSTLVPAVSVGEDLTDYELVLVGEQNGNAWRVLRLDRDMDTDRGSYPRSPAKELKYVNQVVPTRNMTDEKVAALWDSVALTGLDEQVISGLQLVEPRIKGVAFVEAPMARHSERIPLVKFADTAERFPLHSLGDGAVRLFQIVVALVNVRNGILLVDEFENGLHWSVQAKLWETVFRLAGRFNVQVFASTHSKDCVSGFGEAWSKHEMDGAFFRLDRPSAEQVKLTHYTRETLSDSLETDVEVR